MLVIWILLGDMFHAVERIVSPFLIKKRLKLVYIYEHKRFSLEMLGVGLDPVLHFFPIHPPVALLMFWRSWNF